MASQRTFNKSDSNESVDLSYEWLTHAQQPVQLSFSIPKDKLNSQFKSQKNYMPHIAQRHVYIELMKAAQKVNPKEARVKITKLAGDYKISVSGSSPEMVEKWQANMASKQQLAFDQYLEDNYYIRFKTHLGQEGVKPDHLRYLAESRELVLPAAQAIYDKMEPGSDSRDYVNLLMSWIQSIPYNELEDRLVSNGSGYFSPVEVLTNNLGDSDSKTTLAASLMRALLPNLQMVLIFLPDHALLGANLAHRSNEQTLTIDGVNYLLMEPTGPALMKIGSLSDKTLSDIASGMYTSEKIP